MPFLNELAYITFDWIFSITIKLFVNDNKEKNSYKKNIHTEKGNVGNRNKPYETVANRKIPYKTVEKC